MMPAIDYDLVYKTKLNTNFVNSMICKETNTIALPNPSLVTVWQFICDSLGANARNVLITSGYRSPQHSLESKKKQVGLHTQASALDISVKKASITKLEFVRLCYEVGVRRIGIYKGHVHIDVKPDSELYWSKLYGKPQYYFHIDDFVDAIKRYY